MDKNSKKMIKRDLYSAGVITREGGEDSRRIRGYALVFDTPSVPFVDCEDWYMDETIARDAISEDTLKASDIVLTMFHDDKLLLGRSNKGNGGLEYGIDDHGVWFEAEMPKTTDGDKALELVNRGILSGCSFAAGIDPDKIDCESITLDGKEVTHYTIREIAQVYDFTLTHCPRYDTTEVSLRDLYQRAPIKAQQPAEAPIAEPEHAPDADAELAAAMRDEQKSEIINNKPQDKMDDKKTLTQMVREFVDHGTRGTIDIRRNASANAIKVPAVEGAGLVPEKHQGVIYALTEGVIYDKLGIPLSYSNSGTFTWTTAGVASVSITGEGVDVVPQTLALSKIAAKPERVAAAVEVSREAIYQSETAIEDIVNRQLNAAVRDFINKVMLSTTKVTGAATLAGPLVAAPVVNIPKAYTYKDLVALKAKPAKAGLGINATTAFVVSHDLYATLESTPRDAGSGLMIIEDGKLAGVPVFASDAIGANAIAYGDWSCQAAGFFGDLSLIVDPYTGAKSNTVNFVLNFGFATATLRQDGFVLGKIANS